MDDIKDSLRPYTEWLPPEAREFLDAGGWWLVFGTLAILVLFLVARVLRGLWRGLFRRPAAPRDWDRELRIDLNECPLPTKAPGDRHLTVYHVPVRLRLVVVAPAGTETAVDALAVERLLDVILPGLALIAQRDRPRIRVWPGQLSHQGFVATFHRCTPKPEGEDRPSRWVLVGGRAQIGKQSVLLGLGLWAEEPNMLGRLTLEPHQWLDVLRLRTGEL